MSNAKEVYLTEEGLEQIKEELNYLKLEKRPEIVQALKDARALGDFSGGRADQDPGSVR